MTLEDRVQAQRLFAFLGRLAGIPERLRAHALRDVKELVGREEQTLLISDALRGLGSLPVRPEGPCQPGRDEELSATIVMVVEVAFIGPLGTRDLAVQEERIAVELESIEPCETFSVLPEPLNCAPEVLAHGAFRSAALGSHATCSPHRCEPHRPRLAEAGLIIPDAGAGPFNPLKWGVTGRPTTFPLTVSARSPVVRAVPQGDPCAMDSLQTRDPNAPTGSYIQCLAAQVADRLAICQG